MAKSKKSKTTSVGTSKAGVASDASLTTTNVAGDTAVANDTVETAQPQAMKTNGTVDRPTDLGTTSNEPEALSNGHVATENASPRNESVVSDEAISHRAYEIYLERAGAPGNPLHDWQRAERELRGE